jgi:hypothetical protein
MAEFDADSGWGRELGRCLRGAAAGETGRFMAATSLDTRRYRERFAAADPSLAPLLNGARVG